MVTYFWIICSYPSKFEVFLHSSPYSVCILLKIFRLWIFTKVAIEQKTLPFPALLSFLVHQVINHVLYILKVFLILVMQTNNAFKFYSRYINTSCADYSLICSLLSGIKMKFQLSKVKLIRIELKIMNSLLWHNSHVEIGDKYCLILNFTALWQIYNMDFGIWVIVDIKRVDISVHLHLVANIKQLLL